MLMMGISTLTMLIFSNYFMLETCGRYRYSNSPQFQSLYAQPASIGPNHHEFIGFMLLIRYIYIGGKIRISGKIEFSYKILIFLGKFEFSKGALENEKNFLSFSFFGVTPNRSPITKFLPSFCFPS